MRQSILVYDEFFADPVGVRDYALSLQYHRNDAYFKGTRADWESQDGLLDVCSIQETFMRLLDDSIADWYSCFQLTTEADPLVYHSDHQRWAGAVYLDPQRIDAGTSFWKDRKFGHRRPTGNPYLDGWMYAASHLTSPDTWELVDRVGSAFNRLVLWDAQLVHSATTYDRFTEEHPRLTMLFFFN